jgi:MOSC domain-containing protein YiiM
MPIGTVVQINVSNGGVPKLPVAEALVGTRGIVGDDQADKEHHGGPDQALCIYSFEVIEALQEEGHPISPGSTGENVTVSGLEWALFVPGTRVRFGEVRAALTDYATPCSTIRESFAGGRSARIDQAAHPGWSRIYARVLEEGTIRPGDRVEIIG